MKKDPNESDSDFEEVDLTSFNLMDIKSSKNDPKLYNTMPEKKWRKSVVIHISSKLGLYETD